jgi:hypothetical protein
MTEAEWLACADPLRMLTFLEGRASERKLRLFAVACCRRVWHRLGDKRSQIAVETAEKYADGRANETELSSVRAAVWQGPKLWPTPWACTHEVAHKAAWFACQNAARIAGQVGEADRQVSVLRDIFGNPFRPVSLDAEWLTSTVVALATGIYAERAFDRMPILADALQDAGCTNEDVLAHCRDTSLTHVRGCWVVDLVLGKE